MLAQGPVEFPWNPDSDGDDFIGVNDLMALLGEFDSVFSEEALYLSEDSLTAMYDAGNLKYIHCQKACSELPGKWKMPELHDVVIAPQEMWVSTPPSLFGHDNTGLSALYIANNVGGVLKAYLQTELPCFCVTKERPKVEYTYCNGGDATAASFTQCINEKLAEGWYPLSGFPNHHARQGYNGSGGVFAAGYNQYTHASFWRWAD